jgi:hypothetical protein
MGRFVHRGSILPRILILSVCALALVWIHAPVAVAQYAHPHVTPPARVPAPHVAVPAIPPSVALRPRALRRPPVGFVFRRPIYGPRYPLFLGAPFFSYEAGLQFESLAWMNCGLLLQRGLGCNGLPLDDSGRENYVSLPPTYSNAL